MKTMTRTTVGALILGSAMLSGCVYSRTRGGPEAWGWSVSSSVVMDSDSRPAIQIEIPLGGAEAQEYLVLGGGGTIGKGPGNSIVPTYLLRTSHDEDYRLCYRRYFGPDDPGSAILRFFCEVGVSIGTTGEYYYDPWNIRQEEYQDMEHLTVGLGVRWRFLGMNWQKTGSGSGGPRNTFLELSFNHLSDVASYGMLSGGWSFGRSSGGGLGLGLCGGLRSAGPRMGMVYVTGEAADQLEAAYGLGPSLSTIGWQFEYQYASSEDGPTGLIEFIPLVTGLESELSFVSMNILLGMRSRSQWEFMAGPYLSETGYGMTVAVGKTARIGGMAMPINLGVTSTAEGVRASLTFGWNIGQ